MRTCATCDIEKSETEFRNTQRDCKECYNRKRRERYQSNPEMQEKVRIAHRKQKEAAKAERHRIKEEHQESIGEGNKQCPYCNEVKTSNRFRKNRKKCIDCERADGRNYRKSDIGKQKSLN